MKFKLEQQRLDQEKQAAEREERIRKEEAAIKRKQAEFTKLEATLTRIMPQVNEANLIGTELKRDIKLSVQMTREMAEFGGDQQEGKSDICIRVDNKEKDKGGYYVIWDCDKFESRIQMMRENLNEFFDTEKIPDFSDKAKDPWWDPIEPIQIGTSYLGMKSLLFGMGADNKSKIMDVKGKGGFNGEVKLRYDVMVKEGKDWKIDEDGEQFGDVDDAKDMLGKELNFQVGIDEVTNLPEDLCTNIFATYSMRHEPNKKYNTNECSGSSTNHNFNFKQMHSVDCMTDYHIEYFDNG